MDERITGQRMQAFETLGSFLRKCIFSILSIAPIPNHTAFNMNGNRRYSKQHNLLEGAGHRAGFSTLMSMLRYCYELGVKYVIIYAFSIDNFKRCAEEVKTVMELIEEKIEALVEEESIVNQYGVRLYFIGNLELLSKSLRLAAEKAMTATASNSKAVLSICIAYTSTDEIVHAIQESGKEKWDEISILDANGSEYGLLCFYGIETEQSQNFVDVIHIDSHMCVSVVPTPNIIVRSSGENRLSNFLLWQSTYCLLYSPSALWPEIGFWHLVRVVLDFQRCFFYLKKQKQT